MSEGRISFEVDITFAMFSCKKEDAVSPHSSILDALSPKYGMEDVLNDADPPDSEWTSYEDPVQGYVMVEFSTPMPPNKPEVEALVSNDSSTSKYYRFAKPILSVPLYKVAMLILIQGFNKSMIVCLMGHRSDLFCMQTVRCGTKL